MSGSDGDFDDFLARRKPVFRRPEEDPLEPPAELDRIVLRRARDAIEAERPEPLYHGPRWGMPVALAATLLVALTVILHVGLQRKERVPEVTVQNAARQMESPSAVPAASAPAAQAPGGLVSDEQAVRQVPPAPPPPYTAAAPAPASAAQESASGSRMITTAPPPPGEAERAVAAASSTPAWRHDEAAWLAEIQRLRAAGKTQEADAEQAEFNREHRAYAGAPDR